MKAQERTGAQARQGAVEGKKTNAVAVKRAQPMKKHKADVQEEPESQGKEDEGVNAKQLYQALKDIDEEGEKVRARSSMRTDMT
jgi:hypothetical protein